MAEGEKITSGNFTFTKTSIEGVIIVDVKSYEDNRGYFMETYKRSDFVKGGIDVEFVQDNQSFSRKGVLRGLHFQVNHPQSKLVRVVSGRVFDVAVDLRKESPTFGKWEGIVLSSENRKQVFIPKGFAHGFLTLSNKAELCYKTDDIYHPDDECGLMWNDHEINIKWPNMDRKEKGHAINPILDEKDKRHQSFIEFIKNQNKK